MFLSNGIGLVFHQLSFLIFRNEQGLSINFKNSKLNAKYRSIARFIQTIKRNSNYFKITVIEYLIICTSTSSFPLPK